MTRIRKAKAQVIEGGSVRNFETDYYEFGVHEVDNMLKQIGEGRKEEELVKKLIKESKW